MFNCIRVITGQSWSCGCDLLADNQIGEEGVKSLLLAVVYQTTLAEFQSPKPGATGLMRLSLHVRITA